MPPTSTWFLSKGSTAMAPTRRGIRCTFDDAHICQDLPPLVDRYTPSPAYESAERLASPVPQYSVAALVGSIASAPISNGVFARQLSFQVAPPSWLTHTPPPAAPTQILSAFAGSHTSEVHLPPMFVGPAISHGDASGAAASRRRARPRSRISVCVFASRSGHAA